ncbi:MAG: hypothetical protein R3B06_13840 [Kofleriaceae bacterium]
MRSASAVVTSVVVAAWAPAAGCYQPTFQPGLPCSPSDGCPSGQACDLVSHTCVPAGGPDAGADLDAVDAAPTDRDDDGVPDDRDDCPTVYDPDQLDHDGDGVGDACDACPGIADPTQADTTEAAVGLEPDGVGDACDPWPQARDRVAVFDRFDGDAISDAWFAAGDVRIHDGVADGSPASELVLRDGFPAATRIALEFEADVTGIAPGERFVALGAWLERGPSDFTRFGCNAVSDRDATPAPSYYVEASYFIAGAFNWLDGHALAEPRLDGHYRYLLAHRRPDDAAAPGAVRCQIDRDGDRHDLAGQATPPEVPTGPPAIGWGSIFATVTYAVVYVGVD